MKIAGKRMWERSKLLVWEHFGNPYKTQELFNTFCNFKKMSLLSLGSVLTRYKVILKGLL